jgi:dTDP-N-acetylfucosamine:lipid II N-acetylfucosaminyltransferase
MTKEYIVHCMHAEKFIQPFIDFLVENFLDFEDKHKVFIAGDIEKYKIRIRSNLLSLQNKKLVYYTELVFAMNKADKIILHSLLNIRLIVLLAMQPWLLKRCYWVIWGGDLYSYQLSKRNFKWWRNEVFRRFVIRQVGHFITHVRGDYELAQKWYGAKGVWHECFMYPSNLYHESPVLIMQHEGINILLGNSADPSNNHIDALEKLRPYVAENIQIFCPLSYGDAEYAKQVADYGKSIFGDKFNPLLEFMKFDDYKKLLARIDIAIFNHKRQQGMGNTTTLLGLGKKVFMRDDVTPYSMFEKIGIKVFPISDFNLSLIGEDTSLSNKNAVMRYFSKSQLKEQWAAIYG